MVAIVSAGDAENAAAHLTSSGEVAATQTPVLSPKQQESRRWRG